MNTQTDPAHQSNPTPRTTARQPSILTDLRSLTPRRHVHPAEHQRLAELQANRLRRALAISTPALDTNQIANLGFVEIRDEPALTTSGMSFWDGTRWIILLNPDEPETRRRFTLLHELHHVICHRDRHRLFGSGRTHSPAAERMADFFAACALMPKLYVKRLYGQGARTPDELAQHFEVSEAAMTYRLDHLSLAIPERRCRPGVGQPGYSIEEAA